MLAGRRPFAGETTADIMAAILEREPDWSSLPASTPDAVRDLLTRCLAKDLANRLSDISEARADLDRTPSPTPSVPPSRASRRPIGPWMATAAVAIALGVGAWRWLLPGAGGAIRSVAILPFANTSGNPDMDYLSDGITESLINTLSEVPGVAVRSRNAAFRYKGRDVDAQAAGRALDAQAVVTGRVAQRGDDLAIGVELVDTRDNRQTRRAARDR